jgi:hypothetical protein
MRESDINSKKKSTAPKQKRLTRETSQLPVDICSMIFKHVERPSNLVKCDAKNVYDNKYRVNIYTRHYDEFHDIEKINLESSYFAKLSGDELQFGTVYQGRVHWHSGVHFTLPKKVVDHTPHHFSGKDTDAACSGANFSLRK